MSALSLCRHLIFVWRCSIAHRTRENGDHMKRRRISSRCPLLVGEKSLLKVLLLACFFDIIPGISMDNGLAVDLRSLSKPTVENGHDDILACSSVKARRGRTVLAQLFHSGSPLAESSKTAPAFQYMGFDDTKKMRAYTQIAHNSVDPRHPTETQFPDTDKIAALDLGGEKPMRNDRDAWLGKDAIRVKRRTCITEFFKRILPVKRMTGGCSPSLSAGNSF
jgi:hypothetical protein